MYPSHHSCQLSGSNGKQFHWPGAVIVWRMVKLMACLINFLIAGHYLLSLLFNVLHACKGCTILWYANVLNKYHLSSQSALRGYIPVTSTLNAMCNLMSAFTWLALFILLSAFHFQLLCFGFSKDFCV